MLSIPTIRLREVSEPSPLLKPIRRRPVYEQVVKAFARFAAA